MNPLSTDFCLDKISMGVILGLVSFNSHIKNGQNTFLKSEVLVQPPL